MALNWGQAGRDALQYGTMGAAAGPYGAIIGALLGGGAGLLGLTGSDDDSLKKLDTLDPQQKQLLSQLLGSQAFGQGQNYLSSLFSNDPEAFNSFAAPYQKQFQQETVPALAERFGGIGAHSSSAFNQALSRAGADLSEKLAGLREGMKMQGLGSLQGQMALGLGTPSFAYHQQQQSPSMLHYLAQGLGQGAGQIGGGYAANQIAKNWIG